MDPQPSYSPDWLTLAAISAIVFAAVFMFIRFGWSTLLELLRRQEMFYQRVLVQQLLIDIHPRVALGLGWSTVVGGGMMLYAAMGSYPWFFIGAVICFFVPNLLIRHMEQKRREHLERQLVDAITTLASGVRAGLNLVQAFELLEKNSLAPIKQEVSQLLREYNMGLDLNQAMRNSANRIGSSHYRLLFTAIEMHRQRGGDAGESLDRIAESVREIQRLEGKLDALTAQGRTQARMMGAAPVVLLLILYGIDPEGVAMFFTEPIGRLMILAAAALVVTGFWWIRKIMAIDI